MYKITHGKPNELSKRLEKEIATYDFLDVNNIDYYHIDHPHADTMQDCDLINKALNIEICKNLFLCNRQKTKFYLLMMPGDKVFHTKDLSSKLGLSRLSFADAEYMEKYLNILPGSVSVLGLINDKENNVELIIDSDLLKQEFVGCHPCINTSTVKILTSDLTEKFLPSVKHTYKVVDLE